MAYVKPNTFSDGTTLLAAEVQGNVDALRIYLHEGIVQADLLNSQWVDTRHVQPPRFDPLTGLQHGVTGQQGGQWSGALVRLQFSTSYVTGNGFASSAGDWRRLPNTTFDIDVPAVSGRTPAIGDRYSYVCPYVGTMDLAGRNNYDPQEIRNNANGFRSGTPFGPDRPYSTCNGYGRRTGVKAKTLTAGADVTPIGLCTWSQIDRSAVINWSIALEVWYL